MDIKKAIQILSVNRCINRNQGEFCEASEVAENIMEKQIPQDISNWSEDYGDCLWWRFPVEEPPYCGSPLDMEWQDKDYDNYYTHFTQIVTPNLNLI